MKRKVVKVLFSNKLHPNIFDYKVQLECEHKKNLWNFKGDPINTIQICIYCKTLNPHSLEVLK